MKKWNTGSGKGSDERKPGDGALLKDMLKKSGSQTKTGDPNQDESGV